MKRRLLDLYVAEGLIDRALAFASLLYWELDTRGYQVTLASLDQGLSRPALDERRERPKQRDRYEERYRTWSPDRPTVVHVGTVAIALSIFEPSERVEVRYVDGKFIPVAILPTVKRRGYPQAAVWTTHQDMASGRLCLRASSPYALATWEQYWEEASARTIESMIPSIVKGLEEAAIIIAALFNEGAARAEAEHVAWERQRAEHQRQEVERLRERRRQESCAQLVEIIVAWSSAKAREDFFDDLERRSTTLDANDQLLIRKRIQQARAILGGTDILNRFASWTAPDE